MKRKLLFIITFFTLLFFPKINYGQAPNLGTASGFALFTATGAFTSVGVSTYVTGDVGTNVGAFTAFPPGTVVGQIHVEDATSATTATDVATAYSDLNGITCDSVIGTTLGGGQVLAPGVYCTGGASTLNGNLTLDGQGDTNALFIIKIGEAFATGTFSNVILTNSASLWNVYWQVNGQLDLGDSSVFRGTLVVNGAINLLEGASLFGRGLSSAGAITLNNNIVTLGVPPGPLLPIELLSFTANCNNQNVVLKWITASETNNDYFTVEHTKDGSFFEEVIQIQGAGNSNTVLYYSAIDNYPYEGTSYYRLKQTDFDGKFVFSNLVAVYFKKTLNFDIYPNPFSASTNITINVISQINSVEFRLYNVLGEEVINTTINKQTNTLETVNLSSGIYFYKVVDNDKIIQSGKLVSQQ